MPESAVIRAALLCLALGSGAALAVDAGTLLPRFAPIGSANDFIGYSVAISPPTGALGFRIAAIGTVDRYVLITNGWRPDDPLAPNLTTAERLFSPVGLDNWGLAVAISPYGGPNDVVVVGAPGYDGAFLNTGRIHFYQRLSPIGLSPVGTLEPPTPSNVGNYGTALAYTPDAQLLLVGEPRAQRNGSEVGVVHVYSLATSPPTLTITLLGTAGASGIAARFGQSLAVDNERLVVGAPLQDDGLGTVDTGAIHIFRREGAVYVAESGPLFASDRLAGDRLGLSVSIDGARMLAGAGNDDKAAGPDAGGAYAFDRDVAGTWREMQKLRSGQPQPEERFGQSVLLTGERAYVGAYCVNASGCSGPGALYQYRRSADSWELVQRHSPADGGSFGFSMASDRAGTVLVGSYTAFGNAANSGAAYLLRANEVLLVDGLEAGAAATR